jgi:hypothetical protein
MRHAVIRPGAAKLLRSPPEKPASPVALACLGCLAAYVLGPAAPLSSSGNAGRRAAGRACPAPVQACATPLAGISTPTPSRCSSATTAATSGWRWGCQCTPCLRLSSVLVLGGRPCCIAGFQGLLPWRLAGQAAGCLDAGWATTCPTASSTR